MNEAAVSRALQGWTVVCLRPVQQQPATAAAIRARGAVPLALPGLALEAMSGAHDELRAALACRRVVFTSPAAVEFAARLTPLQPRCALAVGQGTARALAALGIDAHAPDQMRSEGLLALPELQHGDDPVGLVTAPGGRDAIAPALHARGIEVRAAFVYRRAAPARDEYALAALRAAPRPRAVLLTSGEALEHVLAMLAPRERDLLLAATAVASSARLAGRAREAGFETVLAAASPLVESLLDALAAHAKEAAIR